MRGSVSGPVPVLVVAVLLLAASFAPTGTPERLDSSIALPRTTQPDRVAGTDAIDREIVYEVEPGDTLEGIALAHGLEHQDWWALFAVNQELEDPRTLQPGMRLRIPPRSQVSRLREVPAFVLAPAMDPTDPDTIPRVVWERLAACESSGRWHLNAGNGFYGGLQFTLESWQLVGGAGHPHHAVPETQIRMAERLVALQGWEAWPVCAARLGLRP